MLRDKIKNPQYPLVAQLVISRVQVVRMKGLEPPRLAAPDPKSGAAANYATSAFETERKFRDYSEIE
jgi:hypothetical protein